MGLLFINQCALVWPGLWPIFSILQLWVLNVLMVSLYQQMMKGGKGKCSTQERVCARMCVCGDVFTVCLKQELWSQSESDV